MAKKKKKKRAKRPRKHNARKVRVKGVTRKMYQKLMRQIRSQKNPAMRKGKTGRWYKGPRGVKVRVRRSKGKFVVDLRK